MDSKTFLAVVFLGLLATASCQQPLLGYEGVEEDKQVGAIALGVATPVLASLLIRGVLSLGSALYNFVTSTMAGKLLEPISLERLFDTPITESSTPIVHSYSPGGEPPKRRPYTRAMALDDEKPPQRSHPKASGSS